jgi:hypothetical protein
MLNKAIKKTMEGLNYFATKTQSFRSNVKQRHKKQWKVSATNIHGNNTRKPTKGCQ